MIRRGLTSRGIIPLCGFRLANRGNRLPGIFSVAPPLQPSPFFGHGPLFLELHFAETPQLVILEAFLKQIAIDRLRGGRALSRRDNHLAIGRRHTARRVQSRHARAHTSIHHDLPLFVEPCA